MDSEFKYYLEIEEYLKKELLSVEQAMEKIYQILMHKRQEIIFYEKLLALANVAGTPFENEILTTIRKEKDKHYQVLKWIYQRCTSIPVTMIDNTLEEVDPFLLKGDTKMTYLKMLEQAFFNGLELITEYRKIRGACIDTDSKTLLMALLTDTIIHVNKYNFLITMNMTS